MCAHAQIKRNAVFDAFPISGENFICEALDLHFLNLIVVCVSPAVKVVSRLRFVLWQSNSFVHVFHGERYVAQISAALRVFQLYCVFVQLPLCVNRGVRVNGLFESVCGAKGGICIPAVEVIAFLRGLRGLSCGVATLDCLGVYRRAAICVELNRVSDYLGVFFILRYNFRVGSYVGIIGGIPASESISRARWVRGRRGTAAFFHHFRLEHGVIPIFEHHFIFFDYFRPFCEKHDVTSRSRWYFCNGVSAGIHPALKREAIFCCVG